MNNDTSKVNRLGKKIQFGIIIFALTLILQLLNQVVLEIVIMKFFQNYHYYS